METEKTIIQAEQLKLNDSQQQAIITFVSDCWTKGKADRDGYQKHWEKCEQAYHCKMDPIESPELDWMSNICLPWVYDASDSWYAHIHSSTIPRNDQIFTISGRTQENHPGADMMQSYLEYRFERNQFGTKLAEAERMLSIKNHACLKVYWKEETTIRWDWVDEPVVQQVPDAVTGQVYSIETGTKKVRKPKEEMTFNNVWIDVIELENFVMYPIRGDFNKTTRIHETSRNYEDLMASADKTNYFNLDQINLDDEKDNRITENSRENAPKSSLPKGLNIKEAWIDRIKIDDKIYRNYVATIVNDKTLIRFQPFPPGCPKSPFVFTALRPDGKCFYGYGLNSKGLDLLDAANKKFNAWIDEGLMTQHGAHKYYEDGVFNPFNIVKRPGAMIKMAGPESVSNNLIPLVENPTPQQQLMQDLAALKVEFEQVTVPKVVKGMIDVGRDTTATEQTLAQNNSSSKMDIDANHINDTLILQTLELAYQAVYDRIPVDPSIEEEIRTVCKPKGPDGQPLEQLPTLPLPEVDIKIVGYQNVVRKQQTLMAMGQAIPQLAQSPAGKYLLWGNLAEDTITLLDQDKNRWLMPEEARKSTDEQQQQAQEQQQQMLVQQEMAKLQLQKDKQDQDYQIKLGELNLMREKLQLDMFTVQQQAELNEYKAKMSQAPSEQSETGEYDGE